MTCSTRALRLLGVAVALALMLPAGVGQAGSPAAIAPVEDDAGASFRSFAASWMQRVHERAERSRERPTVRPGAAAPIVTWRGAGSTFETELQPTGHPASPWVGVLRYHEYVFSCQDLEATRCHIASTQPIIEIFRLRAGSWAY